MYIYQPTRLWEELVLVFMTAFVMMLVIMAYL
jgi:hypothetical protein